MNYNYRINIFKFIIFLSILFTACSSKMDDKKSILEEHLQETKDSSICNYNVDSAIFNDYIQQLKRYELPIDEFTHFESVIDSSIIEIDNCHLDFFKNKLVQVVSEEFFWETDTLINLFFAEKKNIPPILNPVISAKSVKGLLLAETNDFLCFYFKGHQIYSFSKKTDEPSFYNARVLVTFQKNGKYIDGLNALPSHAFNGNNHWSYMSGIKMSESLHIHLNIDFCHSDSDTSEIHDAFWMIDKNGYFKESKHKYKVTKSTCW